MRSLILALVLTTSLGTGVDLLTENFDGAWSTVSPPAGWQIFYTGDPRNDDWHRREGMPWTENTTPYAAIFFHLQGDTLQDSLITPAIDCSDYRNVTLSVNTYFERNLSQPYVARLVYSVDGGANYTVLRNYWNQNVWPVVENFDLDDAAGQSDVVIAWVFEGNKSFIRHWAIDDVVVSGDLIPDDDIECAGIESPPLVIEPGFLSPAAVFRNNGRNAHLNVPVECRLYDDDWNQLETWSTLIADLQPGAVDTVVFAPAFEITTPDWYNIEFWCEATPDDDPDNDTLRRRFRATWFEELGYDNGTAAGYDAWPVGHYGWAAGFDAAQYPVQVESLKVFLRRGHPTNPDQNRYQLAVFADDGGTPGRMLYRSPVLEADDGWNTIPVADNGDEIIFTAGPFYVAWLQVGEPPECAQLGYDNARTPGASYWRVLDGGFEPDPGSGDYMIRAFVNRDLLPVAADDLRTTHIQFPRYEFVQRPYNAPVAVRARFENHGSSALLGAQVRCDIFDGMGPVFTDLQSLGPLNPGEDSLLEFDRWVPEEAGLYTAVVRATLAGDMNPNNDVKVFEFEVRKGAHTGLSASGEYAWVDSDTLTGPAFEWVDPHPDSSSVVFTWGYNRRIYVPIYWDFPYYDTSYNNVYVTTNGWLSLGPDPLTRPDDTLPVLLPDPTEPNRVIAPWWDNFACGEDLGGGRVWARYLGTEPNRRFVVIWDAMHRVGTDTTAQVSFQAMLHENGQVTFQYLDVNTGDLRFDNARSAAIGLDNAQGDDGLAYLYARPPMSSGRNDLENRVRSGTAIRLNPVRRDIAALAIIEPAGYTFPQEYIPVVRVQNYGTVVEPFWTILSINPGGYLDSVRVDPGLLPGDSLDVQFAPWNAEVGTYSAICSTAMAGDIDPANDVTSSVIIISPWVERPGIPVGSRRRRSKDPTLAFASIARRLYALKGHNDDELWTYDLVSGEWSVEATIPLLPSGRRPSWGNALAHTEDVGDSGTLWVLKGRSTTDFYAYDIASKTFIPCSGAVVNAFGYRVPRKGTALAYVPAIGLDGSVFCLIGSRSNLVIRYDIADSTWNTVETPGGTPLQVPYGPFGRRCGLGSDMVFADTALFVVKGSNTVEAYSLNPFTGTSRELNNIRLSINRDGRRRRVRAGASLTALDNALFLLKGGNQQEFWKYPMNQDSWIQLTDIPYSLEGKRRKPKFGSAMVAVDSTIFCLKGAGGYEFWEYKPSADTAQGALFAVRPNRSGVMSPGEQPLELQLFAGPNPTAGRLAVRCNLPRAGRTRIAVYDASGRLVRRLVDAWLQPGRHSFAWDGLDETHRQATAGVYLLRLEIGSETVARKLVVQR